MALFLAHSSKLILTKTKYVYIVECCIKANESISHLSSLSSITAAFSAWFFATVFFFSCFNWCQCECQAFFLLLVFLAFAFFSTHYFFSPILSTLYRYILSVHSIFVLYCIVLNCCRCGFRHETDYEHIVNDASGFKWVIWCQSAEQKLAIVHYNRRNGAISRSNCGHLIEPLYMQVKWVCIFSVSRNRENEKKKERKNKLISSSIFLPHHLSRYIILCAPLNSWYKCIALRVLASHFQFNRIFW